MPTIDKDAPPTPRRVALEAILTYVRTLRTAPRTTAALAREYASFEEEFENRLDKELTADGDE